VLLRPLHHRCRYERGRCSSHQRSIVVRSCYAYDALHRVTAVTYPSGSYASRTPAKTFVYDVSAATNTLGRLAEAYTGPSSSKITDLKFAYSARGEVTDVYELTPHSNSSYYHVNAAYWPNGLVNTLNPGLSGLPTWTYNPDGEGRVSTISASVQNPVTNTSYNVAGQPTGVTFGSGDSDAFQYDSTGRMTQYQATIGTSPSQVVTGALTWNPNGSLRQLAIADSFNSANTQTCTYVHDDLARLGQVDCGTNNWGQTFSFDQFGNISWTPMASHNATRFQPGPYTATTNQFPTTFGSYDANGNLTSDGAHSSVGRRRPPVPGGRQFDHDDL